MNPVILKTLGGLSKQYYIRQFLFGSMITVFLLTVPPSGKEMPFVAIIIFVVNTFLYPYSRFVYESVYDFILGDNVYYANAFLMLFMKIITMSLCWSFAIVIAPIGLMYLYYHSNSDSN